MGEAGARPTLAIVAAGVGVSTATVSKVLNGRPDVAAATRARVERALAEHGYVPVRRKPQRRRGPDRQLRLRRSASPYTSELLRGVISAAAEAEVDVVVAALESGDAWPGGCGPPGGADRRRLRSHRVLRPATDRARLPVVAIDALSLPSVEVVTVGSTNATGAVGATEHLIGLGHERIAFVGGPATSSCADEPGCTATWRR